MMKMTIFKQCILPTIVCFLPFLSLCHGLTPRLVVFAGPQQTSETSIEAFFYNFAHGPASADTTQPEQQALKDWLWPRVENSLFDNFDTEPHRIFDHLITDVDNEELQTALLEGIKEQYDEAYATGKLHGIIMGSEHFDYIGPTPYSDYDAIDAVKRVGDTVGINATETTIILLYRLPRMDQWLSLYQNISLGQYDYEAFLCEEQYENRTYSALHNSMTVLWLADKYGKAGYNVQILDLSGLEDIGLDIEHLIGCDILEAGCDAKGQLINLAGKSFLPAGSETDFLVDEDAFHALSDTQKEEMEQLFQIRDCAYQNVLDENENVQARYRHELLEGCISNPFREPLLSLSETEYFLEALRNQIGCASQEMDLTEMILEATTVETLKGKTEDESTVDPEGGPNWTIPAFFAVFVVTGVIGLAWVRRSDRWQRGRYDYPELQMSVSRNPNLSMIA